MGVVTVYVLYLLMSFVLTVVTASVLAGSGKTFLTHVFAGDESLGRAVSRLLVVGSCLLNLGVVILAMRTSGSVHDARQAVELLSVKLGEALLIIGALHVLNVVILTRIGRRGTGGVPWRPAHEISPAAESATGDGPDAGTSRATARAVITGAREEAGRGQVPAPPARIRG